MTDNSESTFQPHSDEELARLLEEQMRAMRSATPITSPQPVVSHVDSEMQSPAPAAEQELGIDDLFGALLEDTTDIPVVEVIEEEVLFVPSVEESMLEHTQPLTYIQEDVVEVAVVEDHVIVEETLVEEVIVDAHVIAERVLSEISIDGEIVATTVAQTAGLDPIPQMFGEAIISEPVATPVYAAAMSYTPEGNFEVIEDVVVEEEVVEEVVIEESPQLHITNSLNSFAPRPSFDELVFGVKADD